MVTIITTERLEQGVCIQIEDVILKGTRKPAQPSIKNIPDLKEAN